MASPSKYNVKNSAVKRILQEIREVQADTSGDFISEALEDDIFEWHFCIRGPADSEFEGGIYHGRILLPAEYPFKPPGFMMLTPSGRFETGVKICLTISSYHPEQWQPSWSVRTALTALVAFMPSPAGSAVGSLDYSKEERKALALKSRTSIPKFGSPARQRITDEMHARMLAMVAEQPSASPAPGPADAPTSLPARPATDPNTGADESTPAPAASPLLVPLGAVQDADAPAVHAGMPAAPAPHTAPAPAVATAAGVFAPSSPGLSAMPSLQGSVHVNSPAAQPAASPSATAGNPTAASSPAAQLIHRRLPAESPMSAAQPAHGSVTGQAHMQPSPATPRAHPAAVMPPQHAHAAVAAATAADAAAGGQAANDTWGLTMLAVVLGIMVVAILLRKALAAAGFDTARPTSPFTFHSQPAAATQGRAAP